jgi:alkanesulfonate monooxygenase SsuD/methylene tetrahydromethanopterin reductase-like flavin-dependent oxidoreductase (luciferase family)
VASLDVVSGGRVIFGPGLGYRPYEYEALGLPFRQRGQLMSECLEIVQGVWEHESFSHSGKFYSFENVAITPRPVQRPRMPIWVGANSDAAMQRAARLGDGWIVGFSDRLPKLVPRLERYRALASENGRSSTVCLMRLVGIGPTRAEVESSWLPQVYERLRSYARVQAPTDRGDQAEASLKAARKGTISLADLGSDILIAGNPDDCIAGLQRAVEETQCDHVLVDTGEPPTLQMLELFSHEVMPAFR